MSDTDESEIGSSDDEFDDYITLGKSSEFEPIKWRFPDTNQCPLNECYLSYSTRTIAKLHFRLNHSTTAMLCSICDIPFSTRFTSNLQTHYEIHHPNEVPPKLKSVANDLDVENNEKNDIEETNEVNDTETDWITLSGCGKITRWQFPPILTRCPDTKCCLEFGVRSAAIAHYKMEHAQNSILCHLCDRPVCANVPNKYKRHYRKIHPNVAVPFQFDQHSRGPDKYETQTENLADGLDDKGDNLIELRGCGKITCWQFPQNLTYCPDDACRVEFENPSIAIQHYQEQHAQNAIFCYLCNKPIATFQSKDFIEHYHEVHPNEDIPFRFDEEPICSENREAQAEEDNNDDDGMITLKGCNQITYWQFPQDRTICPFSRCKQKFAVRLDAINHYRENHSENAVLCPTCDIPIRAYHPSHFLKHYTNRHQGLDPPAYFDDYATDSDKPEADVKTNQKIDLIQLSGCKKITFWQFPSDLMQCPVRVCRTEIESRSEAIQHYKNDHAKDSILCYLCDRPICAPRPLYFINHFRRTHPKEEMPFNFDEGQEDDEDGSIECDEITSDNLISAPSKIDPHLQADDEEVNDADDTENDWITLTGCGHITQWQFPQNRLKCPVRNCGIQFTARSEAITHYKQRHAMRHILCSICNKPVCAELHSDFIRHYQRVHPTVKIPNGFGKTPENDEIDSISPDEIEKDDENDLIILNGCGYTTTWHFPQNLTRCPIQTCHIQFETRSNAIAHYKTKHAKIAIFCHICDKPICSPSPKTYIAHYRNIHPNVDDPFDFDKNRKLSTKQDDCDSQDDIITLEGFGVTTKWRFPKNMTRCPSQLCRKEFGNRPDAIAHYQQKHAKQSCVCTICNKPIRACSLMTYRNHYRNVHPNAKFPYDLHPTMGSTSSNQVPESGKVQNEVNANEIDDLITLHGFGVITQWRFPKKITQCPVRRCQEKNAVRSQLIAHYKRRHAKFSVLCSICDKPICTKFRKSFILHYQRIHPNENLPIAFTQSTQQSTWTEKNDEDDFITLYGCGKITKWRFPDNLTDCPNAKCLMKCGSRSAAMDHFKEKHAKRSIYCSLCDKPISAHNRTNWVMHYKRLHSNVNEKTASKTVMKRCKICTKSISSHQFKSHMLDVHQSKTLVCPLKDCNYKTQFMNKLRTHWSKMHGTLRFPELRHEFSSFVSASSTNETNQNHSQKPSTSKLPRDLESELQPNGTLKIGADQMDAISEDSLLVPLRVSEYSYDKPKITAKKKRNKKRSPSHLGMERQSNEITKIRKLSTVDDLSLDTIVPKVTMNDVDHPLPLPQCSEDLAEPNTEMNEFSATELFGEPLDASNCLVDSTSEFFEVHSITRLKLEAVDIQEQTPNSFTAEPYLLDNIHDASAEDTVMKSIDSEYDHDFEITNNAEECHQNSLHIREMRVLMMAQKPSEIADNTNETQ